MEFEPFTKGEELLYNAAMKRDQENRANDLPVTFVRYDGDECVCEVREDYYPYYHAGDYIYTPVRRLHRPER